MSAFAVPPTQNTAPVFEFRCLYTHDQRQKQKRWQDGTLKYHTFNRRIMVYDESMNYVSDAHWKNASLQDGDELRLQNGVIVEVSEAVRTTQTDLTPLLQRRQRPPVEGGGGYPQGPRNVNIPGLSTATKTVLGGKETQGSVPMPKHKSLTALLGTPRGALGKAVLPQSPYEVRNGAVDSEVESSPASKRHKGDTLTKRSLSNVKANNTTPTRSAATKSGTRRLRPAVTTTAPYTHPALAGEKMPRVQPVIDITSDTESTAQTDSTFSDLTPLKPRSTENGPRQTGYDRASGKSSQNPMLTRVSPPPIQVPSSPPVNSANRFRNVDSALRSHKSPATPARPPVALARNPRAKAIQLSKSNPKPKLLCMKTGDHTKPQIASRSHREEPSTILSDGGESSRELARARKRKPRKEAPQARVGAIDEDAVLIPSPPPQKKSDDTVKGGLNVPLAASCQGPRTLRVPTPPPNHPAPNSVRTLQQPISYPPTSSERDLHEMNLAYGRMDQQLLQPQRNPPGLPPPPPPPPPAAQPSPTRAFRRVQSENNPRSLADPPRITAQTSAMAGPPARSSTSRPPKQPLRRVQSVASAAHSCVAESLPSFVQPMKPPPKEPTIRDLGPWSTEAFDLFDWCPPDWEQRVGRIPASVAMVD